MDPDQSAFRNPHSAMDMGRDLPWPDCLRAAIDELNHRREEKLSATWRLVADSIGVTYQSVRNWYLDGRQPRDEHARIALRRFFGWGPGQLILGDGDITFPGAPQPCTADTTHYEQELDDPVRRSRVRRYAEKAAVGGELFEVRT